MSAQAETVTQDLPAWINAVTKAKDRFNKQAKIHGAVEWDAESAFIRQAFQASPELQNCVPRTITNVVELIGSIGISTSPLDKLAFIQAQNVKITPKNVKPEIWEAHAVLKIQFTGLIKLLVDSGACEYIRADVVHESDDFTYNGPTAKPDFKVSNPFSNDRGPVVGAFAEALCENGITYCEILRIEELNAIKAASKSASYGPWKTFENEMRKKAAIRRLYKTIPKRNQRVSLAVSATQDDEGFEFDTPSTAKQTYSPDEKKAFDAAVTSDDCEAIWHMSRSLPVSIWTDLVGSGEKGKVTALRNQVRELEKRGLASFQSTANELDVLYSQDDELGAKQILEEYEGQRETLNEQLSNISDAVYQWCEGL